VIIPISGYRGISAALRLDGKIGQVGMDFFIIALRATFL
jgi:hypothetical protein